MGKRGPQPVDMGLLLTWEFEFYKAFHLLRDGIPLPAKIRPFTRFSPQELHQVLSRLKQMSAAHYWLTTNRFTVQMGERINLKRPPTQTDLLWAEQARDEEIYSIQRSLHPPMTKADQKRLKIWNEFAQADTNSAVREACRSWAQLPGVRGPFPEHVSTHAGQFIAMKQNKRFPRSNYADDARLEFLARGMAGILVGVSPMTGIERLRNMKHKPGGPMWVTRWGNQDLPPNEQHCRCWRCSIERSTRAEYVTQTGYENGLRHFMGLAASTKVPREWGALRSRLFGSNS